MLREEVEVCPHCMGENILEHDVEKDGYQAVCAFCGEEIMLCDACSHSDDNPGQKCDWTEKNGCFRMKNRQGNIDSNPKLECPVKKVKAPGTSTGRNPAAGLKKTLANRAYALSERARLEAEEWGIINGILSSHDKDRWPTILRVMEGPENIYIDLDGKPYRHIRTTDGDLFAREGETRAFLETEKKETGGMLDLDGNHRAWSVIRTKACERPDITGKKETP